MRYQMLFPLLLANHEIAGEVRPLLLAENGIHLIPQKVPFNGLPEDRRWRIIDLPPSKFRPLIKRAKLTLSVPRDLLLTAKKDGSVIVDGDGIICQDIGGVLWLETLRTITQLGFALDELVIEAEYARDARCFLKKDGEIASWRPVNWNMLKQWVEKDVRGCVPEARDIQVIFKENKNGIFQG